MRLCGMHFVGKGKRRRIRMSTIEALRAFLEENRCDFELIRHERPMVSTQDAAAYFDLRKAAPVLVGQTEKGWVVM